jgi:hypothetical protein
MKSVIGKAWTLDAAALMVGGDGLEPPTLSV